MKHIWALISPGDTDIQARHRCENCGLERDEWPLFGLWRPWPRGNHCTGYYD